jgi:5-methylcytosine-specific restriction endonuclease McrA
MKPVADEFVLEIEKYLDDVVNNACDIENVYHLGDYQFPNEFREAVGEPFVLLQRKKLPEYLGTLKPNAFEKEFFMLDFGDFLEYSTSNLATDFSIDSFSHNHCYYYQALPGSYEKPLFANRYGKFSIMGACLSRHQNHLWIIVQFKAETEDSLEKKTRMVDLVTGKNNFLNYFVTLHLMDWRRESFSTDKAFEEWSGKFPVEYIPKWIESTQKEMSGYDLVEVTRNCLSPPFETDYDEYFNVWGIKHTGEIWTQFHELLAGIDPANVPKDNLEAYKTFMDVVQPLNEWEEEFNTEMADNFEVARLMRFLPSYFDFMYDLVITEKKKVGHELVRIPRRKKKKTKVIRKPIYKLIKSLRISYLAEEETRNKLRIPLRTWTAPSYQYAVRGHWRQLRQPCWIGHDQEGEKLIGKTWVKDHVKGPQIDPLETNTKTPNVVIKLKQPLSYARDVIKSHEVIGRQKGNSPGLVTHATSKPSKEWMYQERIKLTFGLRWIILKRDDFRCRKCGRSAEDGAKLHVDHILPIEKWGKTEESNLMTLCRDCNLGKGATI